MVYPLTLSVFTTNSPCSWKMLNELTGVKLKMSSAYHPQTDRSSECSNKAANQSIWYFMQSNQTGWVKALPIICFNIMNTINSSTNMSGFQLCLGHSPWIILPIVPLQLVDTETLTFPVSWKTSKIWLLKQGTPPTGEDWPISFCYCITGKGD